MTALECEISKSARSGKQFAVLSLDLDHFKDVNDSAGHPIGDQLLRLVSERLRSKIRKGDSIARFGGDEFAILLGDKRTRDVIGRLADRIIKAVAKPFLIDGKEIHVGASIGIAIKGAKDLDAETLLSNADIALYRAKAEGRQIYRFYSDAMNEEVRSRIRLTRDLRFAVPGGQLFLVYQPQIRTETRRVIGVAALVRWRHPLHGVLEPDSFLAIAENCGMMGVLGHWVLAEACRQGRRWIDAGIAPVTIGVNLSTAQFKAPLELEKSILSVLAETNMPPHLLELEITENTLINLSIQHVEIIQRLRRRGIRFSLDDFGTGYSSLNYLRHVAVDRIKIAREFVTEVTTSKEAASIVKLILGLARDLGNEVIAEGVETPEQLNLLQSWNCPDVQGYCFSAPVSADAMTAVLTTGEMQPVTVLPAFAA